MSHILNRKWRKYVGRLSLRARFFVVLLIVVINSVVYFGWQRCQDTRIISDVTQINNNQRVIDESLWNSENSTIIWKDITKENVKHKYKITFPNETQEDCPEASPRAMGRFIPDLEVHNWTVLEDMYSYLNYGHWGPPCYSNQKVAVIIPYRNRETHLQVLINNLHSMLYRQNIEYGIFVVEQLPGTNFNRALLFNIGFTEALKWYSFNCFVFHDVDLIPENDHNIYSCGSNPRHLSAYIDKFYYKLPYPDLFGGVSAISIDQLRHVNGFSNLYFGWGGEDDDMSNRLRSHGYKIYRYPKMIGSYKMIKHVSDNGNDANVWRFGLVRSAVKRMHIEGLNNLEYTLKKASLSPLMVWLKVQVDEQKIKANYSAYMTQTFFDSSFDYQIRIVAIMLLFFVGSIITVCGMIICTISGIPDSSLTLKTNRTTPTVFPESITLK